MKLYPLQVLRFVAAMMVVCLHVAGQYQARGGTLPIGFIQNIGYAGVDIFFVISGFIMWRTTEGASGLNDAAGFLWRRFTRIYLGYWPVILLIFVLISVYIPNPKTPPDWFGSFTLLPTQPPERGLDVSWTLTFELAFYLCMATAVLSGRRAITLWVLAGATLAGTLLPASPIYGIRFFQQPIIFEFLIGCLIASFTIRRPMLWIAAGIVWGVGAALLFMLSWGLPNGWERLASFGVAAGLIVAGVSSFEGKPSVWSLLGDASYALYLLHMVVIGITWRYLPESHGIDFFRRHLELGAVSIVLLSVAVSVAYYRVIELPLSQAARLGRTVRPMTA